jgi:hypothetical protein
VLCVSTCISPFAVQRVLQFITFAQCKNMPLPTSDTSKCSTLQCQSITAVCRHSVASHVMHHACTICTTARPESIVQAIVLLSHLCAQDSTLWLVRVSSERFALVKRIDDAAHSHAALAAACSTALLFVSRFQAVNNAAKAGLQHWYVAAVQG